MIYYATPYNTAKNLGLAYNKDMERLPNDNDYCCFTDGDTMFLNPYYGFQIEKIVAENPDVDMFTCMTNRVKRSYQCVKGMYECDSLSEHYAKAIELASVYNTEIVDITKENLISGVMIMIKKSSWRKVGGFLEGGMLGIDNAIHLQILKAKGKVALMTGIYLLHWYRGGDSRNKSHLL